MKKLMIAIAAIAAFVSVASADDAWFTGTIGQEYHGEWTMTPGDGEITTNDTTTLVLDDAQAEFVAAIGQGWMPDYRKSVKEVDIKFTTRAKFAYSYDELPEIDEGAKAGVVVVNDKFYVLTYDIDGETNKWEDTEIVAAELNLDIDIVVTITNGDGCARAAYKIGTNTVIDRPVYNSEDELWGIVDYKGSGEIASLVGTTVPHDNGYPIPGGKTIPTAEANAWATAQSISPDKLAEILADTTTYAGGRTAAESCILGVGTNDNIVANVGDTKSDKLELTVVCSPIPGRATFTLKMDGDAVVSGQSSTSFEYDLVDGIYTVVAYIDGANKELPVSQEIGVKGTSVAASTVYFIGAPWDNCAIADLFKKTCCTEGDKVEVYDAASDSYKSWVLNSDGAWEFATGQGDAPALIKKGQAVKYTTAASTTEEAKLWQIGNVSAATTTEIVAGGAEGDNWNLLASPKGSFKVSKLPLDGTKARALVLGGDDGITPQKIYLKVGGNLYVKEGWAAEAKLVEEDPVLEGGFFLKTKEAEAINWNADK